MKKSACAFLICILLFQACSTLKVQDYPKGTTTSTAKAITLKNLSIATKPITDKDELDNYFGTNLLELGIVPIYVISENKSSEASFVISKDGVLLKSTANDITQGVKTDDQSATGKTLGIVGASSFILTPVGGLFVGLPMIYYGSKLKSDAVIIKQNIVKKQLQTRTVSPGKTVDGFVYFQFPDRESINRLSEFSISIEILEIGSNELVTFTIKL